ncbi:MAG: hypothetical protein QHH17_04665 [Candidatus Bathyarchaeota archaeon]|nr:hypothetical protein [Candidatus Bathyarchaeota archaeon]
MRIKKKEMVLAVVLCLSITIFAIYSNLRNAEEYSGVNLLLGSSMRAETYGFSSSTGNQQYTKIYSETIEGELERGAFENVVSALEVLTEDMGGYVKSIYMTYRDEVWSGTMISKVPTANVTSFTFTAREIIDANGTVTYINISVESVNVSQLGEEAKYSTINFSLREVKLKGGENGVIVAIAPILPILTTSLVWIAQGLIIGIPLCFASLGIVLFVNRGIIPLWRSMLKKPK